MRTALEDLALQVVSDSWSNASNGDVNTFGRAYWWSDIDNEFIQAYDFLLEDTSDGSLGPIINGSKHGMFAQQTSDGIIYVILTDTANQAKALYEAMESDYQKFLRE